MATSSIKIDGQKLRDIFKKRGLYMRDVSRTCGYEDCYFSKAVNNHKMSKTASIVLQDRYKIYPDDYAPDKDVVPVEVETVIESVKPEPVISEDTAKLLHKIIYSAVYEAMKKALTE